MRSAVASISLGRSAAGFTLQSRLQAAAAVGFEGIEIVWECLESVADIHFSSVTGEGRFLEAAQLIASWCKELKIKPFAIQAFTDYDGLASPEKHEEMLVKAKLWIKVCQILGCSILQIPANYAEPDSGLFLYEDGKIAADLRELAELAPPGLTISYEPMAWSTFVNTWDHALDIIKTADHKALALCFDTYHWAGREYADPSRSGCLAEDYTKFPGRVEQFRQRVSSSDISYVQLSDVELIDPPMPANKLYNGPLDRPRMSWSRACRIFAWEQDGVISPANDRILEALVRIGYQGWLSQESFHKLHWIPSEEGPLPFAKRAWSAHLTTMAKVEAIKRRLEF